MPHVRTVDRLAPAEMICFGNDRFRDVNGARRLGIRSIFVDSNQGARSHADTPPDCIAVGFHEALKAVAAWDDVHSGDDEVAAREN